MKAIARLMLFIIVVPLNAEAIHVLLKSYAEKFFQLSAVSDTIADLVKTSYDEAFYVMDITERVIAVLDSNEVTHEVSNGDTIYYRRDGVVPEETIRKYNFEAFATLKDDIKQMIGIKRMVVASIKSPALYSKSLEPRSNFVQSEMFDAKIDTFIDDLTILYMMAYVLQAEDSLFRERDPFPEEVYDFRPFLEWDSVGIEIDILEIDRALRRFEVRYGPKSSRINVIELLIIEFVGPFKGNMYGPSHWEPILRFTPVCYNITDSKFFKTFQLGMNYYFFEDGIFEWLNHIGIALLLADMESDVLYNWNNLSVGVNLHLGKYQLGVVIDTRDDSWKVTSTVDFQVVPLFF